MDEDGMTAYRIEELARRAGVSARNIRAFQERGLLPPPRLEGRTGFYDDSHLARIRVVLQLQERGYSIAAIADLVEAWQNGRDLEDLLGLEKVLTDPWSQETPQELSLAELAELFFPGRGRDEWAAMPAEEVEGLLARAQALGFIERSGDRFRVPSPQLLNVGAELAAAGVPLADVFTMADRLSDDCDTIARRFVLFTVDHAGLGDAARNAARDDLPQLTTFIGRLRPLAQAAVHALLARAMQVQIQEKFSDQVEGIARHAGGADPARPAPHGAEPAAR
ncbi:MerR family transcriptional regulator [Thermomonospora umbrina]|uniref:DNA-binding transcriptional MerR regulator n=1 Tax=Thermomonospora umbrina TaxID=111806 RepID=A0A3D9SSA8_9ACTN|nr:MerR family transcriptional regulator [Thermomonospora umbrina]REE97350.1 DNA-binding transcriptional MerR regulator [Thermomonospora umbrina]